MIANISVRCSPTTHLHYQNNSGGGHKPQSALRMQLYSAILNYPGRYRRHQNHIVTTDPSWTHLLIQKLLPSDQSQKLPDELAVLHHGLHVGRLTIGEYLVAHSIDWTIPGGGRRPGFWKTRGENHMKSSCRTALLVLFSVEGKTHFSPFEKVPRLIWRKIVSTDINTGTRLCPSVKR